MVFDGWKWATEWTGVLATVNTGAGWFELTKGDRQSILTSVLPPYLDVPSTMSHFQVQQGLALSRVEQRRTS